MTTKEQRLRNPATNSVSPIQGGGKAKVKPVTCTFHQFFAVWAGMQKPAWAIPHFHIEILDFLSDYKSWDNNTGLLQVFRGAAKSTIVGLWIVYLLTQDPTLRILVLSADKKTAGKITTDVATIVERHPLAKHLHGKENVWRADTLMVNGSTDGRNPSVTSWGVMSNITGARADIIIYDDTEVPKNSRTEVEREKLREKLDEPTHILVPGGYELFVGTPHSHDSIYTEVAGESTVEEPFRTGCSQLKIPVMSDIKGEFPFLSGTPIWPERFSQSEIDKKQRGSATKGHFLSQYLLLPYNPAETRLDPTLISQYIYDLNVHTANGSTVARIGESRVMGYSCVWDPSMGTTTSDDSVLGIVFTTEDGHYYVHRAVKVTGSPEEQCRKVREVMRACEVSHVQIENNGPGAMLPYIFRSQAGGSGLTCEGVPTIQNKAMKILEAYEVRLVGGLIHAHKSVMDTPFRTQLRDFSTSTSGRGKDDYIDVIAMAILAQPIRIRSAAYGNRQSQWQSAVSGGSIECAVDTVTF
jgi:hypothetical protein